MQFTVKTKRIIHETFDDEVVIVDLDSGSYYSLNSVGMELWGCIEQGSTLPEMTAHILQRYSGEEAQVQAAIKNFLLNLMAENLVASIDEAGTKTEHVPQTAAPADPLPPFTAPELSKYTDMQELLLMDVIHDVDETGWPNAVAKVTIDASSR